MPKCRRCGKKEATGFAFFPDWLEREIRDDWGIPDDAYLPEACVQIPLCDDCEKFSSREEEEAFWLAAVGLEKVQRQEFEQLKLEF
jgi:hypothetical protein